MSAYNDALLALGQYVYAAAAFIRCDHRNQAFREMVNERLIGLVDAVDSAEMENNMMNDMVIDLSRTERVVAVVPEACSGPGWSNGPTFVHIHDAATGRYRVECMQPTDRSAALHYLFTAGVAMCASLIAAVPTRVVDSLVFRGDDSARKTMSNAPMRPAVVGPLEPSVGRLGPERDQEGPRGTYGCACVIRDARTCLIVRYGYRESMERCECMCHQWDDDE